MHLYLILCAIVALVLGLLCLHLPFHSHLARISPFGDATLADAVVCLSRHRLQRAEMLLYFPVTILSLFCSASRFLFLEDKQCKQAIA